MSSPEAQGAAPRPVESGVIFGQGAETGEQPKIRQAVVFPDRTSSRLAHGTIEPQGIFEGRGNWMQRPTPTIGEQLVKAREALAALDAKYPELASDIAKTHEGLRMPYDAQPPSTAATTVYPAQSA